MLRSKKEKMGRNRRFRPRFPEKLKNKNFSIGAIIPNITTLLALCSGMTSIRMALLNRWDLAVVAVLFAGFLDAMDGRLARLLGSSSRFGAELDSFSDFISFGVSPAVVLYLLGMNQWGEIGWGFCLFFAVCMALRLARFNTLSIEGASPSWSQGFFTGVPAPAAAFLGLMPIMLQQCCDFYLFKSPAFYACIMLITGGLMISRIPTYSLKKMSVPQKYVLPLILLVIVVAICLYSHPWLTLSIMGVVYLMLIPFSLYSYKKLKVFHEETQSPTYQA
jgi:CDP-diacylglycerol--serine O-phosphatidyltransferase